MLKATKKQKILLYVFSCIFFIILCFRFAISPLSDKNSKLELEMLQVKTNAAQMQQLKSTDTVLKTQAAENEADYKKLSGNLYDILNTEDIDLLITDMLNGCRFAPSSLKIGKAVPVKQLLTDKTKDSVYKFECYNEQEKKFISQQIELGNFSNKLYCTDISANAIGSEDNALLLIDALSNQKSISVNEFSIKEIPNSNNVSLYIDMVLYMYDKQGVTKSERSETSE